MKTSVIITTIICITILEIIALLLGYNGTLLKAVLVVLAGGIGWISPQLKIMKGG